MAILERGREPFVGLSVLLVYMSRSLQYHLRGEEGKEGIFVQDWQDFGRFIPVKNKTYRSKKRANRTKKCQDQKVTIYTVL